MKERIALVLLGAFLSIFGFMIGFGLFLKRKLGRHVVLFFEHPVVQRSIQTATKSGIKEFVNGFIFEVDKPKRYTYTPMRSSEKLKEGGSTEKNREIWSDMDDQALRNKDLTGKIMAQARLDNSKKGIQ